MIARSCTKGSCVFLQPRVLNTRATAALRALVMSQPPPLAGFLLGGYRLCTCGMLPTPRWLANFAEPITPKIKYSSPRKSQLWPQLEAELRATGQEHVLTPAPPENKKADMLEQLKFIDLKALPGMLEASLAGAAKHKEAKLEPFPDTVALDDLPKREVAAHRAMGLDLIANGEVAALLLAGGQGTRLGTSAPKGCYDIGLPSGKSLFQYHCERIVKVKQLAAAHAKVDPAKVRLKFLVMTSAATDAETRRFFEEHGFFGLGRDGVVFFEQGMLPCLTEEGKLMLDRPGEVAMAPNGNGGVYLSLRDRGILAQLERDGVRHIFQFGVDNVLCHVAEPVFLGYCASKRADCAAKTVPKRDPHEPVGVLALADGKPAVVEYSEISREMAEATDPASGRLLFGAAHICVNYFSLPFLRDFCERKLATLPLHVARKKIAHTLPDGRRVAPTANNGVKLELFIFDTFPHAQRMASLQVDRADEFAPVKNPPGAKEDSPDTAKRLIYQLSLRRLEAAGGSLKGRGKGARRSGDGNGGDDVPVVEVSPLLSFQGEGLEARVRGKAFEAPLLLSEE